MHKLDYENLAVLLASLFCEREIFLRFVEIYYASFLVQVEEDQYIWEIIPNFIRLLDRKGLINKSFFENLSVEFPHAEIDIKFFSDKWVYSHITMSYSKAIENTKEKRFGIVWFIIIIIYMITFMLV